MFFKSSKKIGVDKVNQKIVEIVCKVIFVVVVLLGSYTIIDNVKHIMNLNVPREISSDHLKEFKQLVKEFNQKVDLINDMESNSYSKEELSELKKYFKNLKGEIALSKLNDIEGGYYNGSKYLKYPELEKSMIRNGRYVMALNGSLYGSSEANNFIFRGGDKNFYLKEYVYSQRFDSTVMRIHIDIMNYYVDLANLALEIGGVNND